MEKHLPMMDEIKPRCPKCGESGFEAIENGSVLRADYKVVMIACQNETCRTVIGLMPRKEVFKK